MHPEDDDIGILNFENNTYDVVADSDVVGKYKCISLIPSGYLYFIILDKDFRALEYFICSKRASLTVLSDTGVLLDEFDCIM